MIAILRRVFRYPSLLLLAAFFGLALLPQIPIIGEFVPTLDGAKQVAAQPLSTVAEAANGLAGEPNDPATHAKREIDRLKQELAVAQYREAELTRKLMQFDAYYKSRREGMKTWEIIDADVTLGCDASAFRKSILINRGATHGVQLGSPVIHGRVFVGRVVSVGPFASRVQLLADPGYPGVKALVLPESAGDWAFTGATEAELDGYPRGLATGGAGHALQTGSEHDLTVNLRHVELSEQVKPGDLVMTSNHSATVPGGLVIGRVRDIRQSAEPQFIALTVQPWADPTRMEHVQVVIVPPLDLEFDADW